MVAVGGNREAARIKGVKVSGIIFSVYVITGSCDRGDPVPAGSRARRR